MSALIKVNKNIIFKVFSLIYGAVTEIRNSFFDLGILKTKSFDLPIISIGNLAVGGTGKTPHTEFLIQQVSKNFKIAVLSRGYKRETRGFVLADKNSTAKTIGDEPYQLFGKFPAITVAV
ncbi:MAG TPA: tetraacyldisaccharide 4'-kinase, partial [Paludibacteraceae bacterium]|nr:tetraacyldisaccharide 4'-kinase [Paludibacteraceae bacterium]